MTQPIIIKFKADTDELDQAEKDIREQFDNIQKDIDKINKKGTGSAQIVKTNFREIGEFYGMALGSFAAGAVVAGAAIREVVKFTDDYAKSVEKTPELFTSEDVRTVEEYRKNMSQLDEEIRNLKSEAGQISAPVVGRFASMGADLLQSIREEGIMTADVLESFVTKRLNENSVAVDSATQSYIAWGKSIEGVEIDSFTAEVGELFDLTFSVRKEVDNFAKTEKALREEFSLGKISLDEMNDALAENAREFAETTNERILKRTEELLSMDGLTEAEELALIDRGVALGVFTEEHAEQARLVIAQAKDEADAIIAELDRIPDSKTTTINVVTQYSSYGQPGAARSHNDQYIYGFAGGVSDFVVPAGYENDTYPMRVSSGERVNVETKAQQASGSGETNTLLRELVDKESITVDMLTIALRDAMLIGAQ